MKIALIGYGKMGHIIEETALERGHRIVARIDKDNICDFDSPVFADADVAIEFTTPTTAENNILRSWERGVPVVCGTTGWDVEGVKAKMPLSMGLIWTSNYSLGVNILFALNRRLAQIMHAYPEYAPSIVETHHIHKLDAPSGTAKTLAEELKGACERLHGEVPIESIREGEVPGIHTVSWESEVDSLSLTHSAKSRKGFALGAVIAAEWLKGKKGFHTMQEVLGL